MCAPALAGLMPYLVPTLLGVGTALLMNKSQKAPDFKAAPMDRPLPEKKPVPIDEETGATSGKKIDTTVQQRQPEAAAPSDLTNVAATQSGVSPGGRKNPPIGAGVSTGGGGVGGSGP